jgi:hypothetical protein
MISNIVGILAILCASVGAANTNTSQNSCIQFTVAAGTGCAWMCNYCATQLNTPNYYFTDGVCKYESGGCVGNPVASQQYTCCSL